MDNTMLYAILKKMVKSLTGPLAASSAADMTDKSRVYVYTGSEAGYNTGHWYYWDGSAWADGGAYNGVVTDPTLSILGDAADAKAVGDALQNLSDYLTDMVLETYIKETKSGSLVSFSDGADGIPVVSVKLNWDDTLTVIYRADTKLYVDQGA